MLYLRPEAEEIWKLFVLEAGGRKLFVLEAGGRKLFVLEAAGRTNLGRGSTGSFAGPLILHEFANATF